MSPLAHGAIDVAPAGLNPECLDSFLEHHWMVPLFH